MRKISFFIASAVVGTMSFSIAQAACEGSNGRGWGRGQGAGSFTMGARDKSCAISFPGFINDKKKTRIPATQVKVTKQPKSGKISVSGKGITYTPKHGFKGKDRFCTINTSPKLRGERLSGCITITVR